MLNDFKAGGLSRRLMWRIVVGVKLFVVVRCTTDSLSWLPDPCVVVHGMVRCVEHQPEENVTPDLKGGGVLRIKQGILRTIGNTAAR